MSCCGLWVYCCWYVAVVVVVVVIAVIVFVGTLLLFVIVVRCHWYIAVGTLLLHDAVVVTSFVSLNDTWTCIKSTCRKEGVDGHGTVRIVCVGSTTI